MFMVVPILISPLVFLMCPLDGFDQGSTTPPIMMTMVLMMMMGGLVRDLGGIMVMVVPILISPSCFSYVPPGWVRPGIHQTTNHDDHGAYGLREGLGVEPKGRRTGRTKGL